MSSRSGDEDEAAKSVKPTQQAVPKAMRYSVLGLSCLLAFGGYLVFDLCATLETQLMEALDISNTQYSLLYTVYAWTNCAMVLFAGALIDNTANRLCAIIFCGLACLGQTVLTVGVQIELFWLMVLGRTVFGMGLGSVTVCQNTISNTYFRNVDLSTAFAATLTVSRIGSVTNFLLSPYLYEWWGSSLPAVFWWGTGMTVLSVLAAVILYFVDSKAEKSGMIVSAMRRSRKIQWRDILKFPPIYWVLCIICSAYYINIFCMMAILPDFLQERNGYSSTTASMISSCVYFMAIPCVPIFGRLIDNLGFRLHGLLIAICFMIPFDLAMGLTTWNAIPFLLLCGASYSLVASSLWPSVCMVVKDETVGTANGICTSIQMIGIGCSNLIVGALRDAYTYREVFAYLTACASLGVVMTIVAQILDYRRGAFLNTFVPLKNTAQATEKTKLLKDDNPDAKKQ
ncbi:sodium glucose transporter [Pelomyxa schiedti]|nr:sodium glucose transporter [Pelomyxa schiedti]